MTAELKENYGHLLEEELLEEISSIGIFKDIPENFKMIEIGDYVSSIPLLINGAIKILREDKDGNELLLYYLEKGDTCSMTMTCCLGQQQSEIRAIAETDTRIILLPISKMEEWMGKYKSWRNFVFSSYQNRLNELFLTLDSIAFYQLDERLVKYLKEKTRINKNTIIQNTHKEIAYDLNSNRVVVSRLLKRLEKLGKIELGRNHLKVLNL
ncbi:Crp/Fnr family transcriptional regulator [Formosa sp. S-31]|uniref:Crp/Fnr family transcriptional regulator n=1 Tax=Formosa sp. S-31 TaxID=2790949 RepID=UPI003EC1031C